MASNAAAEPLPPLVLKIVAVAEKAEDVLFEKQGDIRSMESSMDYAVQRLADLADQHEKAPAKEKKHFVAELSGLKEQIAGMKKELATARGQATKMQHRINEIRQKARDTLREIRHKEAMAAIALAKRSVAKGCGHP
jgi:predicted  nucleic acid-binding Zn-ribbon protein